MRKSGCGPGLGELAEIWGFPFNISATAGVSDFKFCMPLGFAKAHHKITPRGKCGRNPGLGNLPKIRWFLSNISATAEASDFKFGTHVYQIGKPKLQLGFAKPIIKSHPEKKWA